MSEILITDHFELDELLAEFFQGFADENVEQIYLHLDLFWARLAMHIRAEHLHLFPAILQRAESNKKTKIVVVPLFEKVKDTITNLQTDHNFFMREILAAIKQMHDLRESDQQDKSKVLHEVREKVIAVQDRLEKHNKLEETEVYGWADTLLQMTECSGLNEKMQKEITNLPPRFEKSKN